MTARATPSVVMNAWAEKRWSGLPPGWRPGFYSQADLAEIGLAGASSGRTLGDLLRRMLSAGSSTAQPGIDEDAEFTEGHLYRVGRGYLLTLIVEHRIATPTPIPHLDEASLGMLKTAVPDADPSHVLWVLMNTLEALPSGIFLAKWDRLLMARLWMEDSSTTSKRTRSLCPFLELRRAGDGKDTISLCGLESGRYSSRIAKALIDKRSTIIQVARGRLRVDEREDWQERIAEAQRLKQQDPKQSLEAIAEDLGIPRSTFFAARKRIMNPAKR